MYVCMYVCMYLCMYLCIYIYVCVCFMCVISLFDILMIFKAPPMGNPSVFSYVKFIGETENQPENGKF